MLFTVGDFKKIQDYEKKQISFRVIGGGWQLIGRDKKIEYIISNLNKTLKIK